MGLLGQIVGNSLFGDGNQSVGDVTQNYFQNRLNSDLNRVGANVQPQSTTISYNPDGSADVTHKVTTTPVAPQPQPAPVAQPQIAPVAAPQPQSVIQPQPTVQPVMPNAQPQPSGVIKTGTEVGAPQGGFMQPVFRGNQNLAPNGTWNDYQDQSQLPPEARMPEPGNVQPVNPAQPQPAPEPAPIQTTPAQATTTTPAAPPAPVQQELPAWAKGIEAAGDDKQRLASIAAHAETPEDIRKLAFEKLQGLAEKERGTRDAQKVIEQAVNGDPKAITDVTRYLRKQGEEGSYIKAYLMHRLGLHELGKQEEQKLGGGNTIMGMMANGQRYTVENGPQGVLRAWDVNGRAVDDKTLAAINATAINPKTGVGHAGATRIRDAQGTEWSVVPTTQGSIFVNNSGQPGVPVGKTTPITGGTEYIGQMAMQHNKQVQEYIAKYGVDAVIKQGGKWMNPITGEFADVDKGGFNPYLPGGTMKPLVPPTKEEAKPSGKKMSYEDQPVEPAVINTSAPGSNQPMMSNAVYTPGDSSPVTQTSNGGFMKVSLADLDNQKKLELKGGETGIEVGGARSKNYNEYLDNTLAPDAKNGYEIGQIRRRQRDILTRPGVNTDAIFGLYNAAGDSPNAQKGAIIRDIMGGWFGKDRDEVSKRIANLNLDPATRSALEEYALQNAEINKRTLKSVAGGGSVSDAEQEANRKSNVDPTTIPSLAGFNAMAQSQFNGDLAAYKGDWAVDQKTTNTLALEKSWRKEATRLSGIYRDIAEQRIKYINDHGNSTAAVKEGYRLFPIPEYDVSSGTWKKTKPLKDILGK